VDIALLQQALVDRPFLADHGRTAQEWQELAHKLKAIGYGISARTARDRFVFLVSKWRAQEMESLRKSGEDEEYTTRESMLTEIVQLLDDNSHKKNETKQKKAVDAVLASQLRDEAMQALKKKRLRPTADDNGDNEEGREVVAENRSCSKRTMRKILDERAERLKRQQDLEQCRSFGKR
jgi:hypothetical protein